MDYKLIEKQGRTKGDQLYFLCIPDTADGVDVTTYRMQTDRQLPWLVPMRYVNYDGRRTFCYDLEGQCAVALDTVVETRESLIDTMIGICDVVIEAERNLINPLQLIWNWGCIFQGETSLRFIAVPIRPVGSPEKQIHLHLRGLLDMVDESRRGTSWYRKVKYYFDSTDHLNARELKKYLYQIRMERDGESVYDTKVLISQELRLPENESAGFIPKKAIGKEEGKRARSGRGSFFGRKKDVRVIVTD